MSTGLLHLHSFLPYLFLVIIMTTIVMTGMAMSSGKLGARAISLARLTLILAHLQLVIGILLLFVGDKAQLFDSGMGAIMKNSEARLGLVEHPLTMIIAIAIITIGFIRSKKTDDLTVKAKRIFYFYLIALVLILIRIPYSAWIG